MRELEFRLFDTTSKKMYYMPNIGEYTIEQIFRFAETDDPYTKVMQFTGLLDKNGVKIFEGDKLKTPCGHTGAVEFYGASFSIDGYDSGDYYQGQNPDSWDWSKFEVIGNIHEVKHG